MYQVQIPEKITDTETAPKQKVQAGKINQSPSQFHFHAYGYGQSIPENSQVLFPPLKIFFPPNSENAFARPPLKWQDSNQWCPC